MGSATPKQYLHLHGRPILAHTLERLTAHPGIHAVVVSLSPQDEYWQEIPQALRERVIRAPGGAERADSVRNALRCIEARARDTRSQAVAPDANDWALVHDAVRPCLRGEDLDRLIAGALASEHGALLAVPVRDTMKRVSGERVRETVPRDELWHALTPQMFPLTPLREALEAGRDSGATITDEAQAMERLGWRPAVVQGHADNIKITRSEDLDLAAYFLSRKDP